jgi:hypothetical protein
MKVRIYILFIVSFFENCEFSQLPLLLLPLLPLNYHYDE